MGIVRRKYVDSKLEGLIFMQRQKHWSSSLLAKSFELDILTLLLTFSIFLQPTLAIAASIRLNHTTTIVAVPAQTSTFDANDRIGSSTFDSNGSTKISNGMTYNYDFENHLTQKTEDGSNLLR